MPLPDLEQKNKAKAFLAMHSGGDPLLLPNVWDVASSKRQAFLPWQQPAQAWHFLLAIQMGRRFTKTA